MFAAVLGAIVRVLAAGAIFLAGMAAGSEGTSREPKTRRLAALAGLAASVGCIAFGIVTLSPLTVVIGGVGLAMLTLDVANVKQMLKKLRGKASVTDALEYLTFQQTAMAA